MYYFKEAYTPGIFNKPGFYRWLWMFSYILHAKKTCRNKKPSCIEAQAVRCKLGMLTPQTTKDWQSS